MGVIAWIVLGLVAGLIANMFIPGKRSQGLIVTCMIGIVGSVLGGPGLAGCVLSVSEHTGPSLRPAAAAMAWACATAW